MLNMQTFYTRLHAPAESGDAFLKLLRKLTNCTLAEVTAVKSEMIWEIWDAEAA